jgi:hypothetical protein
MARCLIMNCGLCAIPALEEAGVSVLKVPARGEAWRKLRYVQLVRAVLDCPEPTPEFCRSLINSADFCAAPGSCYYSSVHKRK